MKYMPILLFLLTFSFVLSVYYILTSKKEPYKEDPVPKPIPDIHDITYKPIQDRPTDAQIKKVNSNGDCNR